uniref:Anaphase promoting complex subunit 7 n=1 Tax=Eptatretus burgeri TaxID=7764 RepID=A0A8C4X008_EPTBU
MLKAAALVELGSVQEAVLHIREASRLAPHHFECYEALVECYSVLQRPRDALTVANAACKALMYSPAALVLYATACMDMPGLQEKARTLLERALSCKPILLKAILIKSDLLRREQKFEEGVAFMREVLAQRSQGLLHRLLADFLVACNNVQEAMDQYSIALSLDPGDSKAAEAMQKLEREEGGQGEGASEGEAEEMEGGSGEENEGDLEVSDSEAAPWAEHAQWFAMQ